MFASPVSVSASGFDMSVRFPCSQVSNSEPFVLPVSVCELNSELTVCPVPVHESNIELPVLSTETTNAPHVCLVNSVTAIETIYELSTYLVSVNKSDSEPCVSPDSVSRSNVKPFVCPVSVSGSEYELSVYLASIPELSPNPLSVKVSNCELYFGLYS